MSDPQSLNRYAYVLNNPTNFRDPLGLKIIPDPGWFLGGGFGSKCTIDGLDAPCSMATSLVNAGAAAICPNNNCTGLQLMGNTFYQWMLAPFSSVIGSLCPPDQPSQCTPGGSTYNFKWGWVVVGTADSSGGADSVIGWWTTVVLGFFRAPSQNYRSFKTTNPVSSTYPANEGPPSLIQGGPNAEVDLQEPSVKFMDKVLQETLPPFDEIPLTFLFLMANPCPNGGLPTSHPGVCTNADIMY